MGASLLLEALSDTCDVNIEGAGLKLPIWDELVSSNVNRGNVTTL
jgi:hypothetical protein